MNTDVLCDSYLMQVVVRLATEKSQMTSFQFISNVIVLMVRTDRKDAR